MTGGPDLASASLAGAVLARWSWRPAGMLGTQRLLGGLAAHRAPLLEGARRLQAWHDGLAQRWRPLDTVQPARTLGGAGPVSASGIAAPPAPVDGAATARGSPPGSIATGRMSDRARAAPMRINPVPGAGSLVQRQPAAAPAPVRPALTITALAGPEATSAALLPVPFRTSTPAAAPDADGLGLVPAIGRRYARREVAGGFPEGSSRGPGETPLVRPTPLVRWRAVEGQPPDDASARPRRSDGDGNLPTAPDLSAWRAEPALPAHRTAPAAGRRTHGAELVERPDASGALPLPGLSVRMVPPEEAARRLAPGDHTDAGHDRAPGARSEAGARREIPPPTTKASIDIDVIVERVQRELKRREQFERERKGLF